MDYNSDDLKNRSERQNTKLNEKYYRKVSWNINDLTNDSITIVYNKLEKFEIDTELIKVAATCSIWYGLILILYGMLYSMYKYLIT